MATEGEFRRQKLRAGTGLDGHWIWTYVAFVLQVHVLSDIRGSIHGGSLEQILREYEPCRRAQHAIQWSSRRRWHVRFRVLQLDGRCEHATQLILSIVRLETTLGHLAHGPISSARRIVLGDGRTSTVSVPDPGLWETSVRDEQR